MADCLAASVKSIGLCPEQAGVQLTKLPAQLTLIILFAGSLSTEARNCLSRWCSQLFAPLLTRAGPSHSDRETSCVWMQEQWTGAFGLPKGQGMASALQKKLRGPATSPAHTHTQCWTSPGKGQQVIRLNVDCIGAPHTTGAMAHASPIGKMAQQLGWWPGTQETWAQAHGLPPPSHGHVSHAQGMEISDRFGMTHLSLGTPRFTGQQSP